MNTAIDLSFVARYQYPTLVKEHFERILSHIDASKVESVILTGSTSRGELSYQMTRGALSLYSDYEFMIIAKKSVDKNDEVRLSKCFEELERNLSNNYLFHIDFSYINTRQLRSLPFHLKHYETKKNGQTIYGRDLLHLVPDITLDNLDFKDLHEILIWRLWALLLYLPRQMANSQELSDSQAKSYQYILCRNMLDILTWVLPLKCVLLASFRQRADYLNANLTGLRDDILVDEEFTEFVNECMAGKFEMRFHRHLPRLYADVIRYFLKAKNYLISCKRYHSKESTNQDQFLRRHSSSIFHDYSYRTKGREIKFILKNFDSVEGKRVIPWILSSKYGLMLEFLYTMHLALVHHLENDSEALNYLSNGRHIMQELNIHKTFTHDSDGFGQSWLSLRKLFADFLIDYFYSVRVKRHYIYSVIA